MAVDDSKQRAIKAEIDEMLKVIAIKHGMNPHFTEWIVGKRALPSSTTSVRPPDVKEGDVYVHVDVKIKRW